MELILLIIGGFLFFGWLGRVIFLGLFDVIVKPEKEKNEQEKR